MLLKEWFPYLLLLSCSTLLFYFYVGGSFGSRMLHMYVYNLTRDAMKPADNHDYSAQHVFYAANSSNEDARETVDRSIIILKLMHEYGAKSRANRTDKVILRVGNWNWEGYSDGNELFKNCPVKECSTTSDYTKRSTADVLLITQFHSGMLKDYLPKPRNQIWVESPLANRIDPGALRGGLVNWTVTYRSESTLSNPVPPQFLPKMSIPPEYGEDRESSSILDKIWHSSGSYALGKQKKVAWLVSNCFGGNGRRAYSDELSKYIDVDTFGGCGKYKCGGECKQLISKHYKFYLAFENQNCIEYSTEKVVYNALLNNVLPIVMGARPEDYKKLLPPYSYIHVDDFRSPKHLAEYLHILDKNDTLYNSYFQWKDTWTAVRNDIFGGYGYCKLCFMLHYRDDVNFVNWYEGDRYPEWWNGACTSRRTEHGWQTWRSANFWNSTNATTVHQHPPLVH